MIKIHGLKEWTVQNNEEKQGKEEYQERREKGRAFFNLIYIYFFFQIKRKSRLTLSTWSKQQPAQSPIQLACIAFTPYHSGRSAKASRRGCKISHGNIHASLEKNKSTLELKRNLQSSLNLNKHSWFCGRMHDVLLLQFYFNVNDISPSLYHHSALLRFGYSNTDIIVMQERKRY